MNEARNTAVSATKPLRRDLLALWGGIAFSLAFSALIWWAGQRLASVPHLPGQPPLRPLDSRVRGDDGPR